jgi:hypothetical protein
MSIYIDNFCISGYGDRLLDLFILSILGKLTKNNIIINWIPFSKDEVIRDYNAPNWRWKDTLIENITSFFKLPSYIRLSNLNSLDKTNEIPLPYIYKIPMGGTLSPYSFYDSCLKDILAYDNYKLLVEDTKKEFGLNIPDYKFDSPYITLHLRRTDKLRGVCITQINTNTEDTLENLDNKTREKILDAKNKGYKHFYIASDSSTTKEEYKKYIKALGLIVIEPTNPYNLLESYFDTWIMKSSSLIMVSIKYSTYSLSCALIFNVPLINVLTLDVYKKWNFDKSVELYEEVPEMKRIV